MLIMGESRGDGCSWYSSFMLSVCVTFFRTREKYIRIHTYGEVGRRETHCEFYGCRTDTLFTRVSQSLARRSSSWKELQIITERRNATEKERKREGGRKGREEGEGRR